MLYITYEGLKQNNGVKKYIISTSDVLYITYEGLKQLLHCSVRLFFGIWLYITYEGLKQLTNIDLMLSQNGLLVVRYL